MWTPGAESVLRTFVIVPQIGWSLYKSGYINCYIPNIPTADNSPLEGCDSVMTISLGKSSFSGYGLTMFFTNPTNGGCGYNFKKTCIITFHMCLCLYQTTAKLALSFPNMMDFFNIQNRKFILDHKLAIFLLHQWLIQGGFQRVSGTGPLWSPPSIL